MADEHYSIRDTKNQPVQVRLRRDKRLRRTSRWERLTDGSLLVRVPQRLPKHQIAPLLEEIRGQLEKVTTRRKSRTDEDLQQRAVLINKKYFKGDIRWNAIRWVSDMHTLLGSCSRGGTTDGEIRISDKIKSWPDWVVDYVIAHELLHRKHPNHSAAFWGELRLAYPLTEKARGFVRGFMYATGKAVDDEADE
jgi:predicted metal-dependent hydrolase